MKNPTLHDVAQLAGVSYATVDRVLNGRGKVADKSVRKVQDAIERLGYIRDVAAANLSRKRRRRLAFVLPHRSHPFFGRMHTQLQRDVLRLRAARVEVDVIEFTAFDPVDLEQALADCVDQHYDGIAFVGHVPGRCSDKIAALRKDGAKIVTLVSDDATTGRDHYIGVNNIKAGRTAARLLGMAHNSQPGHVILTVGAKSLQDHQDRILAFAAVVQTDFPNLTLSDPIETKDSDSQMRDLLRAEFESADAITAIYNAGSGNDGLIDVLRMFDPKHKVFSVVHELTGKTRDALRDGVVDVAIDQRPEIEISRALALFQAIIDDLPPPAAPELIPAIYVRDNLPDDLPEPRKTPLL